MEEILAAASAAAASSSSSSSASNDVSSTRETKAACLAFAAALRDLALSASLSSAAASVDETGTATTSGETRDEVSAWLYDQLSTLPSAHLSTLELAQLVGSACASSDGDDQVQAALFDTCLLYTSPSPRDKRQSRMPSSA